MSDLKPCPFCGHDPFVIENPKGGGYILRHSDVWGLSCILARLPVADLSYASTLDDIGYSWNKRHTDSPVEPT